MKEDEQRITLPLKTERLLLRPYLADDADAFFEYMSDGEVLRFEPYPPLDRRASDDELQNRMSDPDFIAVCLPPDADHPWGRLIGHIFFSPCAFSSWEIGWVFNRAYQKKGYACEAAHAVITAAFDQQLAHRIIAMCNPENVPSERLMIRLGMRCEGRLVKNLYFRTDDIGNPVWQDTAMYAVLEEEWHAQ